MNSQATSVMAWRLYRSAISARLVYLREIGRTAFWEFCNTICQLLTSAALLYCGLEGLQRYQDEQILINQSDAVLDPKPRSQSGKPVTGSHVASIIRSTPSTTAWASWRDTRLPVCTASFRSFVQTKTS